MTPYEKACSKLREVADFYYAAGVLHWDEEVNLPKKGKAHRSRQVTALQSHAHKLSTDQSLKESLLAALDTELSPSEQCNMERALEDYEKATRFSNDFVIRLSNTMSAAYHSWIEARKQNDFSIYQKALKDMIDMQREKAELSGYEGHPYNALMDDYEPGATVSDIDALFDNVKHRLKPLLDQIRSKPQLDDSILHGSFDRDKQWDLGIALLKQMGYDFDAGRQDISEHPFTTHFGAEDVRVTTRIDTTNLSDMVWSCIHEGGHALYEQGLNTDAYGLPMGDAVSTGIHESQSRLWENNVGRSLPYLRANLATFQSHFPKAFENTSAEALYQAANVVKPSLIRTESDELTYHFHIMIRYELEKDLIAGKLNTKDLREAWNAAYKTYLQVNVPDDKQGILQDVHWAYGGFGYFPTYSLGSFYAAQFFHQAAKDIPNLEQQIEQASFGELLQWLRKNIHQHGRMYKANELCKRVTGEGLSLDYFMDYAQKKYGRLYHL